MSRIYSPIRDFGISGIRSPIRQLIENTSDAGGLPVTADLIAHYDADDPDTIDVVNDGDPVGAWNDKSGNNFNATQTTTALKPTYKTGILNNRPVIRSDGIGKFLNIGDVSALEMDEFTIFIVADRDSSGIHSTLLTIQGQTTGTNDPCGNYFPFVKNSGHGATLTESNGIQKGSVTGTGTGADVFYLITYQKTSSALITRSDGIQRISISMSATLDYATTFTKQSLIFARGQDQGTPSRLQFHAGDIAEIIIYDSALNVGDVDSTEIHLSDKYGLAI